MSFRSKAATKGGILIFLKVKFRIKLSGPNSETVNNHESIVELAGRSGECFEIVNESMKNESVTNEIISDTVYCSGNPKP
jgi:hypothetical protein